MKRFQCIGWVSHFCIFAAASQQVGPDRELFWDLKIPFPACTATSSKERKFCTAHNIFGYNYHQFVRLPPLRWDKFAQKSLHSYLHLGEKNPIDATSAKKMTTGQMKSHNMRFGYKHHQFAQIPPLRRENSHRMQPVQIICSLLKIDILVRWKYTIWGIESYFEIWI